MYYCYIHMWSSREYECPSCNKLRYSWDSSTNITITDNKQLLERKLEIALEALRYYELNDLYDPVINERLTVETTKFIYKLGAIAREAIKQIEELK